MDEKVENVASLRKRIYAAAIDLGIATAAVLMSGTRDVYLLGTVIALLQLPFWIEGQSIGKTVMRLQVRTRTGQAASLEVMLVRETAGKLVSAAALGLGFLPILTDASRRGWHDRIVRTVVIDIAAASLAQKALKGPPE